MGPAATVFAFASLGFAALAAGLGIYVGGLRGRIADHKIKLAELASELEGSELERDLTRQEFEEYQERAIALIEGLRDEITDDEDMLAACADPAFVHDRFDRLLQEAAGGSGDESGDGLP